MEYKPLVSIIVPVYNAEKFVSKCIESVLNQTYDKWELLLVNDGSSDQSGDICDDMAGKDARIKVIHKKNEGVGKARNDGIKNANGDYLCFVDADDWLDFDALKTSTNPLKDEKFDIIQFGCTRLTSASTILSVRFPISKNVHLKRNSKSELISFFEAGNGFAVWGKLIKKSVIIDNNLFFGTKKRGQDIDFTIKLYNYITNIYSIDKPLYFYRVLYGIQSKYDTHIIDNHIENFVSFYNLFEDSLSNINVRNYIAKLYLLWFAVVIPINIVGVNKLNKKQKIKELDIILSNHQAFKLYNSISLNTKKTFKNKILALIIQSKSSKILYAFSSISLLLRRVIKLSN